MAPKPRCRESTALSPGKGTQETQGSPTGGAWRRLITPSGRSCRSGPCVSDTCFPFSPLMGVFRPSSGGAHTTTPSPNAHPPARDKGEVGGRRCDPILYLLQKRRYRFTVGGFGVCFLEAETVALGAGHFQFQARRSAALLPEGPWLCTPTGGVHPGPRDGGASGSRLSGAPARSRDGPLPRTARSNKSKFTMVPARPASLAQEAQGEQGEVMGGGLGTRPFAFLSRS